MNWLRTPQILYTDNRPIPIISECLSSMCALVELTTTSPIAIHSNNITKRNKSDCVRPRRQKGKTKQQQQKEQKAFTAIAICRWFKRRKIVEATSKTLRKILFLFVSLNGCLLLNFFVFFVFNFIRIPLVSYIGYYTHINRINYLNLIQKRPHAMRKWRKEENQKRQR